VSRKARWFSTILFSLLLIIYVTPWLLYSHYIDEVRELPTPSQLELTTEQRLLVWEEFGGLGEPSMVAMSPWSWMFHFFKMASNESMYMEAPGSHHAGVLALRHMKVQISDGSRVSDWHMVNIVLTIWISRNLQIDDVLSQLFQFYPELFTDDT